MSGERYDRLDNTCGGANDSRHTPLSAPFSLLLARLSHSMRTPGMHIAEPTQSFKDTLRRATGPKPHPTT